MKSRLDDQLELLNGKMIEMGSMCEEIIALIAKALTTGNMTLTNKISNLENNIDHLEREIESLCIRLILKQQPVAGDLRQISAALKMITDMERIGDQASDIADFIRYIDGNKYIYSMAEEAVRMVSESVEAFVKRDVELAKTAIKHDDIIDGYFVKVKSEIIGLIEQKAGDGEYLLDLLMAAKYFERIGDHAVNIAEWVMFSVTGVRKGE